MVKKSRYNNKVNKLYKRLRASHGPMGWWPVWVECPNGGYHPGQYRIPITREGTFEVCMGAVLTQNTSWSQVEKALAALRSCGIFTPEILLSLEESILQDCIRPAGYWRQKTTYLQSVAQWFIGSATRCANEDVSLDELRKELLEVRGVGRETADSILLYAFHRPTFVIDAYTRRVLIAEGLCEAKDGYEKLRSLFMESLDQDVELYQEFHALLVNEAKTYGTGGRRSQRRPETSAPAAS